MNRKGSIAETGEMIVSIMAHALMIALFIVVFSLRSCSGADSTLLGSLDEQITSQEALLSYMGAPVCEVLPEGLTYGDALVLITEELDPNLVHSGQFYERPFNDKLVDAELDSSLLYGWYDCTVTYLHRELPRNWPTPDGEKYRLRFNVVVASEEKVLINFAGNNLGWKEEASVQALSDEGVVTLTLYSRINRGGRVLGTPTLA